MHLTWPNKANSQQQGPILLLLCVVVISPNLPAGNSGAANGVRIRYTTSARIRAKPSALNRRVPEHAFGGVALNYPIRMRF